MDVVLREVQERAPRSVLFDFPSQPVMWVGQVLLMHFANKKTKLECNFADLW